MRRTKIVATIGPACRERPALERLMRAGVDVVRLNFSHGEPEEHLAVMRAVREIAETIGRPIAVLQDLGGPKIRTGQLRGGQPVALSDGSRLVITTDDVEGSAARISTTYEALPADVAPGDRILLDDGNLELRVERTSGRDVECTVVHGGLLGPHKGMNLPGVRISAPALTDKDRRDLAFGLRNGVDFVAVSFVRQAADVEQARAAILGLGGSAPVIAKIEKREAVEALNAIVDAADGVMVARGDLGVELATEEVPTLQKRIIQTANAAGKAVITATQMLESMVDRARPTRAEASDVANAIVDGTDAVMLSAETAVGRYPVEAVETMARIAVYTEDHLSQRDPVRRRASPQPDRMVTRSLARVAAMVAEELECRLIVAFTESGSTARLVSMYRPRPPVAAVTYNDDTYRRLALWWGVVPMKCGLARTTDEMIVEAEALLKRRKLAGPGDAVLMIGGQSHTTGATNMIRVHTIS
ncbi:MAG: pyruvate kinase [Acidobacteria bacterium]|nr:MAG: pyruvate kinase [Acidobacteriota bacterium]